MAYQKDDYSHMTDAPANLYEQLTGTQIRALASLLGCKTTPANWRDSLLGMCNTLRDIRPFLSEFTLGAALDIYVDRLQALRNHKECTEITG